jgi:hypothetical protein
MRDWFGVLAAMTKGPNGGHYNANSHNYGDNGSNALLLYYPSVCHLHNPPGELHGRNRTEWVIFLIRTYQSDGQQILCHIVV